MARLSELGRTIHGASILPASGGPHKTTAPGATREEKRIGERRAAARQRVRHPVTWADEAKVNMVDDARASANKDRPSLHERVENGPILVREVVTGDGSAQALRIERVFVEPSTGRPCHPPENSDVTGT